MSNTLKFGNGDWYGKEGTILAYNDLNSNYKPLPFEFERPGNATRVNKEGLIEVVGNNEPRIDYKDNSEGALLLEPSRSNLFAYSQDFSNSYWSKVSITATDNYGISPNGQLNSSRIYSSNAQSNHRVFKSLNFSNLAYTVSVYAKSNGSNQSFRMSRYDGNQYFSDDFILTNEWQRYTWTFNSDAFTGGDLWLVTTSSIGVGSELDIQIYGAQLEIGSYATSYIPTSGGIATRNADSTSQTVPDGVIGQTEGTLFVDFNIDVTSDFKHILNIKNSTNSERVIVYVRNTNLLRYQYPNGTYDEGSALSSGNHKIAITYSGSNISFFRDGVKLTTNTNFAKTVTFSEISIGNYLNIDQLGNVINQSLFYNNALTDAEAIALTS